MPDDEGDREGDIGIVPGVKVMDKLVVAAGVLVRSYDVMLGTVRGPVVGGGVGEVLGLEVPRGKGVLL